MKTNSNPLFRLINKINPFIIFALILLLSVVIDGSIIFGFSGSSLVSQERALTNLQTESGSNIHIRYSLSDQSEASRLSLINPINDFNAYRIKELGRSVTYVCNKQYEVQYEELSFNCSYLVYGDAYDNGVTNSRFRLAQGSYTNISDDSYIYVSPAFLSNITGLAEKDAIGKKIKLSLDKEKEFIIGGVMHESISADSAAHFNRLFDSAYILFGSASLYKYGFTDLMFTSTDEYFVNDSLDFIDAYNKSYLKYQDAWIRISSYKSYVAGGYVLSNSSTVSAKFKTSKGSDFYSFISILVIVISVLLYVAIVFLYDFTKVKWYVRAPSGLILFGFLFLVTYLLTEQLKAGLFISRLSLVFFMAFMIISLIAYIYMLMFFNYDKKIDKENNNG